MKFSVRHAVAASARASPAARSSGTRLVPSGLGSVLAPQSTASSPASSTSVGSAEGSDSHRSSSRRRAARRGAADADHKDEHKKPLAPEFAQSLF